MELETKCPICRNEKKNIKNKYCSLQCRNIYINSRKDYKKIGKKLKLYYDTKKTIIIKKCENCEKEFEIKVNSKGKYNNNKKFCSIKCANIARGPRTEETKNKISRSLFIEKNNICHFCNSYFDHKKYRKYCNIECKRKDKRKHLTEYKKYKLDTIFKFDLKTYKDEYDFNLIEKYGWYSPTNKNNNLNGVSRDHIFSVKEGFNQNINPLIIAHPANCRLIKQNDNSSKHSKCEITLEELLDKIKKFEEKYGKYYNDELSIWGVAQAKPIILAR